MADAGENPGAKEGKKKQKQKGATQQGQGGPKGPDGPVPGKSAGQEVKGHGEPAPPEAGTAAAAGGGEAVPTKTKAQLKAERRAIQEAQRAAKLKSKPDAKKQDQAKDSKRVPDNIKMDDERTRKKVEKKLGKQQIPSRTVVQRKVALFGHLHQCEREVSLTQGIGYGPGAINPAVLKLGLQYAEGVICGSNARCVAFLWAMKQVIANYTTPPQKEISRDLDAKLKPCINFLNNCRPISVSMGNAIKYLKWNINKIPSNMSDKEAKELLQSRIDQYYKEIQLAGEAIMETANERISDGDVIAVYGFSSLIKTVLCHAHDQGKKFSVIVIDGRPKLEGREMLRRLVKHGIRCTYALINAVSYVMREVTKVLLGAHALLANGYVMSRVGSSQVALVANEYNVPVLVCCETYKFSDRVQTDSLVFNELADPDDLVRIDRSEAYLNDWRDFQSLSLLNLVYDVTPPELVSLVITEKGQLPCTSVPVVLRIHQLATAE